VCWGVHDSVHPPWSRLCVVDRAVLTGGLSVAICSRSVSFIAVGAPKLFLVAFDGTSILSYKPRLGRCEGVRSGLPQPLKEPLGPERTRAHIGTRYRARGQLPNQAEPTPRSEAPVMVPDSPTQS
jgi:hypothetical protein